MRCARAHESGERDGLGSRRQTHYSYTAFLSASSVLASLSRKVMNELRRSLGAKGTPAWRLSTALACLLGVVDGAAQHEDLRPARHAEPRRVEPRLQERARRLRLARFGSAGANIDLLFLIHVQHGSGTLYHFLSHTHLSLVDSSAPARCISCAAVYWRARSKPVAVSPRPSSWHSPTSSRCSSHGQSTTSSRP